METTAVLKDELIKHLHPYFEHKKYTAGMGKIDFFRKTRFGHSSIICSVSGDDGFAYVQFFLGIRFAIVEETLKNLFGPSDYYTDLSHTVLPSWQHLSKGIAHKRIRCNDTKDMLDAADLFIDFMDREGFDFLNYYKSLERIGSLLNDKPVISAQWSNHNYHRCFRAMAGAKILSRPDYDRLFLMHQQYLRERGFSGAILERFNTTFARLKNLSYN